MVKRNDYFIIAVVVLGLAYFGGYLNFLQTPGAVGGGGAPGGAPGGGACGLSVAKTITFTAYNKDTNAVNSTTWTALYSNPATGARASNATWGYGSTYSLYESNPAMENQLITFTTSCNSPGDAIEAHSKAMDQEITFYVYGTDGVTRNAYDSTVTTYENQSIAANTPYTFNIKLKPHSTDTHIGFGPDKKIGVFVNTTNVSQFDMSGWSLRGFDGSECTIAPVTSTTYGVIARQWECANSDFTGDDTGLYPLTLTIKMGSIPSGKEALGLGVAPVEYFQNSLTNAVERGAVTNTGAAIETWQTVGIQLS